MIGGLIILFLIIAFPILLVMKIKAAGGGYAPSNTPQEPFSTNYDQSSQFIYWDGDFATMQNCFRDGPPIFLNTK